MWYLIVSEKFNVMMLVEDHIYTELSMRTETFGDGNAKPLTQLTMNRWFGAKNLLITNRSIGVDWPHTAAK